MRAWTRRPEIPSPKRAFASEINRAARIRWAKPCTRRFYMSDQCAFVERLLMRRNRVGIGPL